jgi:hypothetical protein
MLELADDFTYAVRDGATPKIEYMSAAEAEKLPDGLNDMKTWLDRYPGW